MKSKVFCSLVLLAAAGIVNAGAISINFDNSTAFPDMMDAADLAGAPGVTMALLGFGSLILPGRTK